MRILFAILSLLIITLVPTINKVEPADLIFTNANVYTATDQQPRAEAVAVKMDRIVFFGSNAGAEKYQGPNTPGADLHRATVLPRMTDAHHHLEGVGLRQLKLNLESISELQDFLANIK